MTTTEPTAEIDERYGDLGATPPPWSQVETVLETAELFWISTVRADGRPHVTPLCAVWHNGAMHFATGAHEQKHRNLDHNPNVTLTTGTNTWNRGFDVVVEGAARRVSDQAGLHELADAWQAKYGVAWAFGVADGVFVDPETRRGEANVFRVEPTVVRGFGKGGFSQTRWTF
jgi:nitroimidazol reductase NimA-like FMN-containing flavoprotein (pyridoxamine 5'-phosphate oxidase superfamily)